MNRKQTIDRMGAIASKIAPLNKEYEKLRLKLLKDSKGVSIQWDGDKFRAAVIISTRECYDNKKLEKFLSKELKKKCRVKRRFESVKLHSLKRNNRCRKDQATTKTSLTSGSGR